MKEPLIDRARDAYSIHGLYIIDELIFALTVANKEVERLRESRAELLAAAKEMLSAVATCDIGSFTWELRATKALKAAITQAEELEL